MRVSDVRSFNLLHLPYNIHQAASNKQRRNASLGFTQNGLCLPYEKDLHHQSGRQEEAC